MVGFLNNGESSGQRVRLVCKRGINAIAAIYGANCRRGDQGSLPGGERQDGPMKEECYGEQRCNYKVDHLSIGDPCIGTVKDFYYAYTCNPNGYGVNIGSVGVSEASGQSFTIGCSGKGRVLKVANAIYGLNCGLNGESELDVTSDVQNECNGQSTCTYDIDHTKLGDPCVGIVKDFVYTYQCVPPKMVYVAEWEMNEDGYFEYDEMKLFGASPEMNIMTSLTEASILLKASVIIVGLLIMYGVYRFYVNGKEGKDLAEYQQLLDNKQAQYV